MPRHTIEQYIKIYTYNHNPNIKTTHTYTDTIVVTTVFLVPAGQTAVREGLQTNPHRRLMESIDNRVDRMDLQQRRSTEDKRFVFQHLPEPNRACLVGVW